MRRTRVQALVKSFGTVKAEGIGMLTIVLLLSLLLAACTPSASGAPGEPIDPVPQTGYAELVLYFGDDQAMEVWPEFRTVEVPSDPAQRVTDAELVVQELLKGPRDTLLAKTLPPEAKLLSLEVTDGVAFVNFSKEMQTKHWGGSAGEMMTVASLAASLTRLQGIDKVQILVEGKTIETLAGHFDMSAPFAFAAASGDEVFCSSERADELQKRVDAGSEAWRKKPLEVAEREAGVRGLLKGYTFKMVSSGQGRATVDADADADGGADYQITLVQPKKQGEGGVWVISEIKAR
jgi:hypothetical protein